MLLNYYDERNKVIKQGLLVTYQQEYVTGTWTSMTGLQLNIYDHMYQTTRRANMQYSYVGMDLGTAESCAKAMVALYTRSTKISEWNHDELHNDNWTEVDAGVMPMASVSIKNMGGNMYEVEVNVQEVDVRMSKTNASIRYLFAECDSRYYDGEEI